MIALISMRFVTENVIKIMAINTVGSCYILSLFHVVMTKKVCHLACISLTKRTMQLFERLDLIVRSHERFPLESLTQLIM